MTDRPDRREVPDNDEMNRLLSKGTEDELRSALAILVETKLSIQGQLSQSKADMEALRSTMIRDGMDPRQAQVEATASGDPSWRGSAVRAAMAMDTKIRRIKVRISAMAGLTRQQQEPTAPCERRAVSIPHRSLEEVTAFVQSWLDDGWSVVQSVRLDDGMLFVMRGDNVKPAGEDVAS